MSDKWTLEALEQIVPEYFHKTTFRRAVCFRYDIDRNFTVLVFPAPETPHPAKNQPEFATFGGWQLLGPNQKILTGGFTLGRTSEEHKPFDSALKVSADYLSRHGTMFTYASINLRTKTGTVTDQAKFTLVEVIGHEISEPKTYKSIGEARHEMSLRFAKIKETAEPDAQSAFNEMSAYCVDHGVQCNWKIFKK